RFTPTMPGSGEPGITLLLEDTTQRRRAERAMQQRDRLLHTIFQIPSIPRFFIDRNHKVVFWDRALEIMTGIKSEEIVGTDQHWRCFYNERRPCLADLLVDGDVAQIPDLYGPACTTSPTTDRVYEFTAFFPHAGNSGRWLHVTASVIRDMAGNLTGAMETLEDVTEKKQREFVVEA
ncbi:PAS domain-containing protein, partial [Methanoregula sp.]|uniref:PAS domain-containing protein n=1 Tax=Methanoregula sp. TaxID=2052170 RepID=UPI000CC6C9A8